MTGVWMAYTLGVSAVAAAGALGLERALERLGRPTRWVWVGAMLVGVLAPLAALLRTPLPTAPAAGTGSLGSFSLVDLSTLPSTPAAPALTLDAVLLAGWGAASLVVTLSFLWSAGSLARAKRGWRRARVEGWGVWVSETTGPAVVGFLRPAIVLPVWVLEWETELKRLIVRHEREHVRAGDGRLLLTALLLLCAAPWNVALWWEWRRLREAVETDCDRRVLRSQPDVRRYGTLLLEVANRTRRHALPMAAFAEPRSFLERRLRMMTNRQARNRAGWIAALAGALVLMPALLLALPAPRPVGVAGVKALFGAKAQPEYSPRVTRTFPVVVPSVDTVPVSTPRSSAPKGFQELIPPRDTVPDSTHFSYEIARLDRKPVLMNQDEVKGLIETFYPSTLRRAGVGGRATVQFVIGTDGRVDPTTLKSIDATDPQFATASILAAERFVFSPGEYDGKPARVLIQMPIAWQPPTRNDSDAPAGSADRPDVDVSAPAGMGVLRGEVWRSPSIAEINELIRTTYPQLLDSTPPENTTLSIVAMNDGSVVSTHLEPSGKMAVDAAGLAAPQIGHMTLLKAAAAKLPVDVIWITRK